MIDDKKYGLPRLKKFPMPDATHVKSAIRFFNYVTPANEKELANNILARIQEYDIDVDDINVGDNNRFKKYLVKNTELKHHGIKGQKWGVRRFQNPDGSLTDQGIKRYSKNPITKFKQKKEERQQARDAAIKKTNFNISARRIEQELMKDPDISKKFNKANDLADKLGQSDIRTKQAYWKAAYSSGSKEADILINKYGKDYFDSQVTVSNGYSNRSYPKDSKENYAREKAYRLSGINNTIDDRFNCARADNPNIKNWNTIYKEMKADMSKEDTSYYKKIEDAWLTKHGY